MIQQRVIGTLFGLAAGDSNGGPIRMALCLAESLSDCRKFNAVDVLYRYLSWYQEGAFDIGLVAEKVFARVDAGEHIGVTVRTVHEECNGMTAGCNPVHRCIPFAMANFIDEDVLPDVASQEAALTHFDPLAGDVSAAVVALCRRLIIGQAWSDALAASAEGRRDLTRNALNVTAKRVIDNGGYAPNVLAAAIRFLDGHNDFVSALDASFQFAGHMNYCPVLVGAIGGARWGINCVPMKRVRHVELLLRIRSVAECLAATWDNTVSN